IYGVVLEPFPYKDVDNLVSIAIRNPEQRGWRTSYSVDEYAELARRATIFEGIAASTISDVLWISNGEPVRLRGNHISHNGFDVMGVPALIGRAIAAAEEQPETKVVLGYQFWTRQFGGDPSVLGSTLVLNGRPRTVAGVMPPRFMFRGADVYLPIEYRAGTTPEGVTSMQVTARRNRGVTAAQAEADLAPILHDLVKRFPARYPPKWRMELMTFKETFPSGIRGVLWVMFAAVGLLLLIACANVSALLLARASARQREIAMRAALGAGRSRLFRQLLTESLLLGLIGGALGVAASWAGLKAILAVVPPGVIPDEAEVVLNLPVLLFSFAMCLLTTLLFGFAPAVHAAGGELVHPLQESGRSTGGSRRMAWMRGALVVVELSLAIVLLSGAGLFLRTLLRLHSAPLAVGIKDRLTLRLPLSAQRYPTAEARSVFLSQLLDRVGALPGVRGVGINGGIHPLYSWNFPVEMPGSSADDKRPVNLHQVNSGYLAVTGIGLRQGRWLESADISARRLVVVVNETFSRRYFSDHSPLAQTVKVGRLKMPPFNLPDDRFEIVGVVQDALHDLASGQPRPEMYIPYSIIGLADMLVVHTSGDPMRMAPHVQRQVYQIDGAQFVDQVRTLENVMERFVYSRGRFQVWLMAVFASLGLGLAVVGVYGLLSQIVALQRREFGVRMAVGAGFSDIVLLVLRRGVRLIAFGLTIGASATVLLLNRFGIRLGVADPLDPASIAGACLVLCAAGMAACLIPALRAGRIDPVQALRL
ncbi:MAG: ABC transporter permease, partial [Bryobacteraceae bacterium]